MNATPFPQLKYRGPAGATIFSFVGARQWRIFLSDRKGGEDTRKEEANGRGRAGSCRRPADHDRGIFFRSPTRGNGGLEVLQPHAPVGSGASSPIDADLAPPADPRIAHSRIYSTGKDGIRSKVRFLLINMVQIYVTIRVISAQGAFKRILVE